MTEGLRRFLDLVPVRHPIIQAPMAGVSSPAMAAAVSEAGGLGSIAVGAMSAENAARLIGELKHRTTRPINVNLFCHAPAVEEPERDDAWRERLRPEFERFGASPPARLHPVYPSFVEDDGRMLDVLVSTLPRVVSFHFGLPRPHQIRVLRENGIVLIASVTSVAEAESSIRAGVHAIVAQGWEAGGHRGAFDPDAADDRLPMERLIRLLVGRFEAPVVAAGGIMDGAGIAAALAQGAGAVQLGTAFLATPESLADEGYRAALGGPGAARTVMTRVISGRPARCVANRFTALADRLGDRIPAYPIAYDAGKALHAAARLRGEHGYGAHWAGRGAPRVRALPTAELMARLVEEWGLAAPSAARSTREPTDPAIRMPSPGGTDPDLGT